MAPSKVLCYCRQCEGQKQRAQKAIKKHLELYGLTQRPGDDAGDPDWSALSEDHEAEMISVSSNIDYCLLDAHEALPDVADLDEYENFEPMILEDAKDDAGGVSQAMFR